MGYYICRKEKLIYMQKDYDEIALFRYSLIAPVFNHVHNFKSDNEYFEFISSLTHRFKNKDYKFSKSCVKSWYLNYRKFGISALESKTRSDSKTSRILNNETIEKIINLRDEHPKITGTAIYKILIKDGYIKQNEVSLSTVLRYIQKNNIKAGQVCNVDRRMFEMKCANDMWQADTSTGPYVVINGVKYRTYIVMFIDDKSRNIMGYDVVLNDNALNMQIILKNAIKTYGKPKRLFVDNGGPYSNKQLSFICAAVGVVLINTKVYSPESKAKIERIFRTIKDGWMNCSNWNDFHSIEDVKNSLSNFLSDNYINKVHSSTKMNPNERWHNDFENIKFLENDFIDECFLHRTHNKVRKDRTISFKNEYYEVPFKYVGKTIELRYHPEDLSTLFLYENNCKIQDIFKVDKIANSKVKRKNEIDYSKVLNNEEDVVEMEEK